MRVIYVDDEELAITRFQLTSKALDGISVLTTFQNPLQALAHAKENPVDLAFLDVEMPLMEGIDLARELKKIDPNTRVVFVTAFNQYAIDAFEVDAVGYLMKPYSRESLEKELKKAALIKAAPAHKLFVQTMPTFDVYVDGEVLMITRQKVKELLALLVDRNGSTLTTGQAICALWEDRPDDEATKALYRMTMKRLKDMLAEKKIDYILEDGSTQKSLRTQEFLCDYYEVLCGNREYIQKYHGEYMSEYPWAEETNARLSEMLNVY